MGGTLLLWSALVWAQDAVKLDVVRKGQVGQSPPKLILTPADGGRLDATVSCGSKQASFHGPVSAGTPVELVFDVGLGHHTCSGKLSVELADGTSGEMPLSFSVELLAPMVLGLDRGKVDLAGRRLEVSADRPLRTVEISGYAPDGKQIATGTVNPGNHPAHRALAVPWSATDGDLMRLEVVATDVDGFSSKVELFPWYYEIPHEDVVFESDKDAVRPDEEAKLRAALIEVNKVLDRYGAFATVNLYVGGYTDTVGDAAHNRELSQRRAVAIARWFRKSGFKGAIYTQGFGEQGLAVATGDQVDEVRNRRAAYIVAAETPPTSSQLPGGDWKLLP